MSSYLCRFYAVTKRSAYCVAAPLEEGQGGPWMEKIAAKDKNPELEVGTRLMGGQYAVLRRGGVLLCDDPEFYIPLCREVDRRVLGTTISPIVALFLEQDAALACFSHDDLQVGDPRWQHATQEVLAAIGTTHPLFHLSSGDPL